MFARAIEIASAFTDPYVGLRRRRDGQLVTTMGAFICVNEDGWVLTSAHIIDDIVTCRQQAAVEIAESCDMRIVAHTEIWAVPGFEASHPAIAEVHANPVADLALVRLGGVEASMLGEMPVFRDSRKCPIDQGASVCRLGFPFYEVAATFDDVKSEFALDARTFPIPRFALDGIVARFNRRFSEDGDASGLFIETSTPGLRGQSGGPLVDTEGRVCGIQSHTTHLDLGFDARYGAAGGAVVERQFLNVGAATHVDEARALMDAVGVRYRVG